jgi:hypothetical protein
MVCQFVMVIVCARCNCNHGINGSKVAQAGTSLFRCVCTQVATEDIVLYTAQAYADKLAPTSSLQQAAAVNKLAPLVRCPHLSQLWLSASVLSDDADKLLLQGLQPQLKRLLLLKPACSTEAGWRVADIPGVPDSWALPVRQMQPASSTSVLWELNVAAIRHAALISASQQKQFVLRSTSTSLLGGVRWGMQLRCRWDASKEGTTIGLFACAESLPAGSFCRCTFTLSCAAANSEHPGTITHAIARTIAQCYLQGPPGSCCRGWMDFFWLGVMRVDEAAWCNIWAAKGLPTSGNIKLKLTVKDMGM